MNDIYSFYQLISKYQIEIPIIQRDYAQGRDNAKAADVRNALVKKMINAVEKEDETLFFDFVYGRVDGNKFIPFDGQQRLTTLFLFHKYVFEKCQSESNCGHKGNCICNGILGRFSYATRQSSREFCDKLVQENIVPSGDRKISENIINQSWFYPDWQKDPTVMGMLTMLDEIHSQMKDKNDFKTFAEKLTSGCNCPITFHFVDMGEHKLSDETYVKMNARGKQLTPFENFKASLEQYLEGKKEENLKNRLKGEIDGKWLDLFWDVVNNGKEGEKELPDSLMMSFFNRHFMNVWQCWYATILKTDELDKFNDRIQKEMPLFPTKDDFVSFDIYSYVMDKCGVEKCLTPIFNICDALSKTDNKIKNDCQAVWNRDSNTNDKWDLFHNDTKDETYKSRAAFYALLKYYEKNQETQETQKPELAQWMCIVWNIIENYVEREESYIPALQLIDSIAEQNFNIAKLGDYNGVANDQVKEEIAKAKQINGGDEWESKIIEAEKYAFFKGSIRFLFTDGDWDKFDQKWENAQKYFDENGVKDEDEPYKTNAILLKAVLYHVNDFWNLIEPQKFVLDNTASTWKNNILLDQKWKSAVHKIMIGNLEIINRKDDCLMYKNLYLTNLLDYVANSQVGSRIRLHHGHRTIYPPRYDGIMLDDENRDVPFYRNRILSSMSNVSSKQRIEDKFFKGWNINFEYTKDGKCFAFQWNTDGNVYLIENNNRKKKDDCSFYCFQADGIDKSENFINELDDLIKDAQENGNYEQTSEQ
ncbi:MAG: DUF262 domain-containing protein [Bacteroidales bacterium]|nr:DUF262 domain-containing protein [Bacteroidales bacterium]